MQKRALLRAGLMASGVAIAATATTTRAALIGASYSANADAEIREAQPEFTRGFGSHVGVPSFDGGQATQLQLSQINQNRNIALMRFSIDPSWDNTTIMYASMRIYFRANSNFGSPGGSVRLYGLDPSHPLNATWDEQNVFYRDAGIHQVVLPSNPGTGQSLSNGVSPNPFTVLVQPPPAPPVGINPGTPENSDPQPPIAGSASYGASSTHAQRAPGIAYENPPFSQQIENENQARYTYNQTQRANFLADTDYEQYLPYINQPPYSIRQTDGAQAVTNAISTGDGNPFTTGDGYTNIRSDIPESNKPWDSGTSDSWVDDLEAGLWTLIGYSRVQGTVYPTAPTSAAQAKYISIGETDGFDNTPGADELVIRQNLMNYLIAGRAAGYTTFTFALGRGLGTLDFNGDTVMDDILNGQAFQLASKDLIPTGDTVAGALAPRLIILPEPGSATLAILGLIGAAGLRRRNHKA